ncbi:MAG: hypothetical protein HYZ21_00080 [Chloroflexi bacterium]|nr:hypothetical protein [Chloroflexota bacterium]
MDNRATKRQLWIIFVLAFIVLRTLFALVWDVVVVSAKNDCGQFASEVYDQWGANAIGLAKCVLDGQFATVGHKTDSFLILDMGEGNEIIDNPGVDFYYYERPFNPGIQLDHVEVSVAQDDGLGNPASFIVVFIWGDDILENNGAIPPEYNPEEPNKPINASDLYNQTGIGINIGNEDGAVYRFVRFQTHPTSAMPAENELAEVDAVEGIHPPPPPTLTPTPVETPLLTSTPTPSETPFEIPTSTNTSTEPPTDTPAVVTNPSETDIVTLVPTNTATPMATYTSTAIYTATDTPMVTSSLTDTSSLTSTPVSTPTNTPTESFTPTQTPSNTYTPTITSTPATEPTRATFTPTATFSLTKTRTATFTSSKTSTPTNTLTPTATRTSRPGPTKAPTQTSFPYTPGKPGNTSTPLATSLPTKTYTATLTRTPIDTYTPTITFTPTKWFNTAGASTTTLTPTPIPIAPPANPTREFPGIMPTELERSGIEITLLVMGLIQTMFTIFQFITSIMTPKERSETRGFLKNIKVWSFLFNFMSRFKDNGVGKKQVSKKAENKRASKASSAKERHK